ncbi:hypothetical protein GCM10009854_01060 [Saccharopolyspora halophila]|uniref:MerR family transcriptional regulator n=1 Tax=Saccharopolyspora halophila TaxID=405551 RepID=A0ABN3FGQ5_9PSEU
MTTLERERADTRQAFEQLERLEELQQQLAPEVSDAQARNLAEAVRVALESIHPVRVPIASELLELDEKTVREWAREGVLTEAETTSPRKHLDPKRLHVVLHLVRDLRAAGKTRGLLDAVWWRLQDEALLYREDLAESLDQMRRGEVAKL